MKELVFNRGGMSLALRARLFLLRDKLFPLGRGEIFMCGAIEGYRKEGPKYLQRYLSRQKKENL
jgi:hypothetical protein